MALTASQDAAVRYEQNLILFAGPGSGKTSTSVEKAVRILSNTQNALCMTTFTSAAAEEMRERMARRFADLQTPLPASRFLCGTFHALTLRHFKQHSRQSIRLIAPTARSAMVQGMLANVEPSERQRYTQALEGYQGAIDQRSYAFPDAETEKFARDYYKRLETSESYDLTMVMRECAILMSSGDMPLFPVTHLLGDEIQDADEIQLELVLAHTRRGVITTLVGDDDQCIYEWRSALGYRGMQTFAKEAGAKTIALGENFRSRSEIVHHANTLIAFNDPDRIEKNQRATRGPGGVLGAGGFASTRLQAKYLAQQIALYKEPGQTVAVLARTNSSLMIVSAELQKLKIPYSYEGKSIWDEQSVAVLLSTLCGLTDSKVGSLHPLLTVLPLRPPILRGLERAMGHEAGVLLGGVVPPVTGISPSEQTTLEDMAECFSEWRTTIEAGEVNIAIPQIVDKVRYWYSNFIMSGKGLDSSKRSQIKRLGGQFNMAEDILMSLKGKLSQRIQAIQSLERDDDDVGKVKLMTMHASKGLEFDTVYVVDAYEPDDSSKIVDEAAERRLFFVAITRAKERFYALYSDTPSSFIEEADLPFLTMTITPDLELDKAIRAKSLTETPEATPS